MGVPDVKELLQHINELISATRKGSISWTPVNPTTYVWERRSRAIEMPGARMTLQRIERPARLTPGNPLLQAKNSYVILQVHELPFLGPPDLKLSISGQNAVELNQQLQALFELIGSGISERGLDFFKNLIPQD